VRVYQISDFAPDLASFSSFVSISEIEYIIHQKITNIEISGTYIYELIVRAGR
jgi:hypothetical protein